MDEKGSAFTLRDAQPGDEKIVMEMIRELARYEQLEHKVEADEETLFEWLFTKQKASAIIAEAGGAACGYAIYFYNFSTFLGRAGIYIEDVYVREDCRGQGIGKAFFSELASKAAKEGCGRLEWSCLDWNEPSIDFYRSMNAQSMDDWTNFRLEGEALNALALKKQIKKL